jgi:hypothetical protein
MRRKAQSLQDPDNAVRIIKCGSLLDLRSRHESNAKPIGETMPCLRQIFATQTKGAFSVSSSLPTRTGSAKAYPIDSD